MRITIDADARIPLFEQIGRAIRYEIAVGKLEDGAPLPSVRDAAEAWGVHYLTVRRAYAALSDEGLVSSRPGVGTRVTSGRRLPDSSDGAGRRSGPDGAAVSVVECNGPQAADYAAQVATALDAPVGTWLLADGGDPPPGRIIGTYFHFNEIRARWPHRGGDLRFVSVVIDPDLPHRLSGFARENGGALRVRLLETDASRAHNVIPDLRTLLPPDRFRIESEVVDELESALAGRNPDPLLLSPRLWQRVDEETRADTHVVLLRYLIAPGDLAALGGEDRGAAPDGSRSRTRGERRVS